MKTALLLPRSVLYPAISFDIMDGVRAALQQHDITDAQFTTVNIGVAAKEEDVYSHCEQALMDGAETVIAYINPQTAEFIHPLFENSGKLLLVLDSGFHFPSPGTRLKHAFFLTLDGNLCCRIATRLAAAEGARKAAFTCSFFDAGFRSGYSFHSAIAEQGGSITFNHVTALKRQDFTIDPLVRHMQDGSADTILASFCGDMAEDFLRESAASGILRDYRVVGSSFMAEELWLDKFPYPEGGFMTAVPWGRDLDLPANKLFRQALPKPGKANVFSLLGWNAGLLLAVIAHNQDATDIIEQLEQHTWDTPRGKMHMDKATHYAIAPVYQAHVVPGEQGNCRLQLGDAVSFANEERSKLQHDIDHFEGSHNSWFNAYPCLDS